MKNIFNIFKKSQTSSNIETDYDKSFNFSGINLLTTDNIMLNDIDDYNTSWVNSCINVRAENVSDCETYLFSKTGRKLTEINEHPFLDLIDSTNVYELGWNQLLYLISQNLDVFGNAYVILIKNGNNRPVEFLPVPSTYVKPIYNNNYTLINGYNINGTSYLKEDILHFRIPNLKNNLIGKPTIHGLNRIIRVDNYQQIYSEKYYKNSGRLSIALETSQKLSAESVDKLRNQLKSDYSGVDNAGKTIVLDNGLSAKDFSQSAKEMDYVESRKVVRNEILSRMRVPPVLVGVNESANRASADIEMEFFLKHTIKPFSKNIETTLNNFIRKYYGKNLVLRLEHPNNLSDSERKDFEIGLRYGAIKLNEYRDAMNYESENGFDIMSPVITNNSQTLIQSDSNNS